jgi:hypothetical protein
MEGIKFGLVPIFGLVPHQQFQIISGQAATFHPKVGLKQDADYYILENKNVAVKIPARSGNTVPGPIASVKLANGKWVGNSFWKTKKQLKKYSVTVVGDGTIFGKLRLRYEFETANIEKPVFSEIEIMLAPEWEHVSIFEKHEMGPDDYWEFEMSSGWSPDKGISKQFNNGPGGDGKFDVPPMNRPLLPIKNVSFAPDLYINLIPAGTSILKMDGHLPQPMVISS